MVVTNNGLIAIARVALESKSGARALRSVLENILTEPMFRAPSETHFDTIVIDECVVLGRKKPILCRALAADQSTEDVAMTA